MRNFWLMARHEYLKLVGKRSFILSTLAMPLVIVVVMGVSILASLGSSSRDPVGFVDQAGILPQSPTAVREGRSSIEMRPYADEAAARAALAAGEIQAYLLVPADYLLTLRLAMVYGEEAPGIQVREAIAAFLRGGLIAAQADHLPAEMQTRLLEGNSLVTRSADGSREIGQGNWVNVMLPFVAGFFFVIAVIGSAGYLLQVVTDEKENRTMEIMVTSLSPGQMIGGKALGLMGVSLTQLGIWLGTAVIAILVAAQFLPILQTITMPWGLLLITALFFLPTYALIAGIMTAIGGSVTELKQGQQIAGLLNLVFIFPYILTALILFNPNSPMIVAMTLFPTSAFATITLRWGFTVVPLWQVALSWVLLVITAVFSIWASGRIFRAGMLRYGQGLNLSAALKAVRS
jgi:ABC-2 type transport system permease protein